MPARLAVLVVAIALCLGLVPMAQVRNQGEITGRVADVDHGALPGVRVVVTDGPLRKETVTDERGRFTIADLRPGRYNVTLDLAGFFTKSGSVDLSAAAPRAYLEWRMEVGCLDEHVRVQHNAKAAARLADAIVHVRLGTDRGGVLWSHRPGCSSSRYRDFSMTVLQVVAGRARPGGSAPSQQPVRLFVSPHSGDATPGRDYIALLWETGHLSDVWQTGGEMLLPVTGEQRIAAPWDTDVHGLRVPEALSLLERWSKERR